MTTDAPDAASAPPDLDRVVDAGAQVQETVDGILPHVDADTAAREFVDLSNRPRGDVYGGLSAQPMYEYKRTDGETEPIADGDITEEIGFGAVERRCADHGIDAAVVNPTLNLGLAEVNNDRFAVALAAGYNDWLVEGLAGHDRLVGNAVVAPQHPGRAAEEIDRVADEPGVVGLHLPVTGLDHPVGHRRFDPVYEAVADHGLPVTLQPTVGISEFHQQFFDSQYFAEDYPYHHPFLALRNLASLLFEGVPVRFPDLEFLVLDCGVGWAPYAIMRLDDHYLELGYEIPALEKLPSEYLADSVYWGTAPIHDPGTHPHPDYLARMVEMVGPGNVVFASDLPHPVTDTPAQVHEALAPAFDDGVLADLFGGTAASVFDL